MTIEIKCQSATLASHGLFFLSGGWIRGSVDWPSSTNFFILLFFGFVYLRKYLKDVIVVCVLKLAISQIMAAAPLQVQQS